MRVPWLIPAAIVLLAAGCGAGDEAAQSAITICDAPEDSWANLESETGSWDRSAPQDRIDWTDEAGCAINLNFVFHRFGDEHCDTQAVQFISIGSPIGTPYTTPDAQDWEPLFFHNTDGAFDFFDPGVVLSTLPEGAADTGLRAGERSLWATPSEDQLFIDDGTEVLVFVPVADEDVACA